MALCEVHGDCQIANGPKLTGIHAPPPTLSLIKFQGPRTKDLGPRSVNLGPEAIGSWIEDLAPRTVVLGTRASTATANIVIL